MRTRTIDALLTLILAAALTSSGCSAEGGGGGDDTTDTTSTTGTDTGTEDTGTEDTGTEDTDTEDTDTEDTDTEDTDTEDTDTEDTDTEDTDTEDTDTEDTETCEAVPECAEGETQVADSSGCLQDDAVCYEVTVCGQTIWCTGPAAPPSGTAVLGGGYSFGECIGACKGDLTVDPATGSVSVVVSGWDGTVHAENAGTLTPEGVAESTAIATALVGVPLEAVYGCPDCADGGASHVNLELGGVVSSHSYEYGDPPADLEAADDFVSGLIDDLLDCKTVTEMTPADGCTPWSN